MGDCFFPPGTSFAPLGPNGAQPARHGHVNSMTESAQWGRFSEHVQDHFPHTVGPQTQSYLRLRSKN